MKIVTLKRDKVVENLDRNLAILGLIASLILILSLVLAAGTYIELMEVGVLLFLACASYLAIRKRLLRLGISSLHDLHTKQSTYLILNLLFFILFFYSIISIILRADAYSRPLGYFVSTALMATILAIEILFLPKGKAYTSFLLVKILLIALSLRWIPQLVFPGLIGIDPWFHQTFTTEIVEAGTIPGGYIESKVPMMHLIIGATLLITDLDYEFAAMFSISLLQVIGLIFVFLLGRFIFNSKVGLLAALLLGVAEWWINLGMAIHPTALAFVLVALLIYMILKAKEIRSITLTSLSLLIMGVLILTHTITVFAMAILLFSFWLGFEIYKKMYRDRFDVPVSVWLSILFAVGMLTWWIYACGWASIVAEFAQGALSLERGAPPEAYTDYSRAPLSEFLLYMFGFILLFAFSAVGLFYMLAKRFVNRHSFALVVGGLVLLAMIPVDFARDMSLSAFFAHRWFWNTHLIMAIPAAIGFLAVCGWFRSKFSSGLVLAILIFIISFFSITAPQANFDNRIYTQNTAARYAFTESELSAMNTISNIEERRVGVAATSEQYYFIHSRNVSVQTIEPALLSKDFTDHTDMIVMIRDEIVNNYFTFSGGGMKLDYDPREILEEQGFDRVYDCRSTSAFSER
jgi:hypothetical protein